MLEPGWRRVLAAMEKKPSRRHGWDDESRAMRLEVHYRDQWIDIEAHFVEKGKYDHPRSLERGEHVSLGCFSGLDRRIAELWMLAPEWHHSGDPLFGDLMLALPGHSHVTTGLPSRAVTVRAEMARVVATEESGRITLRVMAGDEEVKERAPMRSSQGGLVVRDRGSELVLFSVPRELERLVEALGAHGAPSFPPEALSELMDRLPVLEAAAKVELPDGLRGFEEPPSGKMVVQVAPRAVAHQVVIRSEPLLGGAAFVPGVGADLSATFDGTRRRFARRDREAEVSAARALAKQLGFDGDGDDFGWELPHGDRGLEVLRRLKGFVAQGVAVEWTSPAPIFRPPLSLDQLVLKVSRKEDWFEMEAALDADEDRVTLAALLESARQRRRWVTLDDGKYAELSEPLAAALRRLAQLPESRGVVRLTPGAVPLLNALQPQVKALEADEAWARLAERVAAAGVREHPLPPGFEDALRDYQREGFVWMSRLADWGAGAVLADDMGLGKTRQALAVLASRQSLGSALVVAPTSVLHNWKKEAARLAPELKLRLFGQGPVGEPGVVTVVSWSTLAREGKNLQALRFGTVVLDEAQAIKNAHTQRSKAAHKLQTDFMLALTGTPVENHLGEVWSLFRAVMPGLLGSEDSFRSRFMRAGDTGAAAALAELVRPFILRRTKAEVAQELPPRTELDVLVQLSEEEQALYDDVRLAAVAELAKVTGEQKRFETLAALTRLRLAACHPRLVDATWRGGTSKLGRLRELVAELVAGGHKVLLFSQFTQHLALVRAALEADGVRLSYLDGQVPSEERQRRVDAFQEGTGGSVFLISLRAGGTGLTLTAADYVVHLDPWWNPAVEDQASDRAHRLGQTRPVTVYRLIAEGTVEQRILGLHAQKRELVEALLSGADQVGKLSAEELAGLMGR